MSPAKEKKIVAYIGLGSNLDNPAQQIISARQAIGNLAAVRECAFSSLYRSPPMGPQDQPDYVNAVMAIETSYSAMELLRNLQRIERDHGRVRNGQRWGARTLDLDLIIYGDRRINITDLIVPHIGIAERAFVLYPLNEIAPQLIVPGLGRVSELTARCPREKLTRM